MTVGGTGNGFSNAIAAAKAAAEAARRAAEAAAKAAAEAAAKAAAEAARKAAAEAAQAQAQSVANAEGRQALSDQATAAAQAGDHGAARMMRNEMRMGDMGDAPWDAEDRAAMPPAAKRLEEGVSFQDLQADPAFAKEVAALQQHEDPKVRALVEGSAKAWVQESLDAAIADGKGKDPKAVFDGFKADIQGVGDKSGLGPLLSKQAETAVHDSAVALLESKPSMQELKDNPAKGQLLATLQADGAYKDDVAKLVQGYAQEAIDRNLEGKKKPEGVEEAVDQTTEEMVAFAKATGLGEAVREGTNDAFKASEKKFEETAEKGKSVWDRFTGFVGGMLGKAGDVLGAGLDKLGDVSNAALDVAGDLAEAGADLTASGLDAIGADGLADGTRAAGDLANQGLDIAGDVANTGLDLAGVALADGAAGIADKAMQAALGDEKPEYKGELDGVTGAITNRLGKGDSVYMGVSGGATVGVGVYGKMGLGAEAMLSRNDDGTISLTLEGEVSGAVGVAAKTGAKGEVEAGDMGGSGGASAAASAEVNAKATARLTLTFDPRNPADAARLKALIEPDLKTVAAAATNPMALAAVKGDALADAVEHNKESITVGGQVGVAAEANAKAGAGPLEAEVGVEASAVVGGSRTFKTDGSTSTTVYMSAGASASIGVSAGPASLDAGAGVKAALGMTIKRDADGNVTGVSTERGVNASVNAGASVDGGAKGSAGHSQTSKVTETLTPQGVEAFNRLTAQGKNPIEAYAEARKGEGNTQEVKSTTTSDEFSIGAGGEVAVAGVQVGLKGRVTVGKSHTDEVVIGGPSETDRQLNQDITNFDD